MLLEEDAAPVAELLLARLVFEGLNIVVGLLVGEEVQSRTIDAVSEGSPVLREPASTVSAARRAKGALGMDE